MLCDSDVDSCNIEVQGNFLIFRSKSDSGNQAERAPFLVVSLHVDGKPERRHEELL